MSFFSTVLLSAQARPRELPPMPEVSFELQGMSGFSEGVGVLISWLLFIIPLVASVVILLGVLYIVAPPLRSLLDGGRGKFREGTGQGNDMDGLPGQGGMDGMQSGMNNMGGPMGGMGNQGQMGMAGGMGMGGGYGGGYGGGMGMGRRGGMGRGMQQAGMQQGMPQFGPCFVLPVAISIGLITSGSWEGVKLYIKEMLVIMIFVGLALAITSLGTVFGASFNIGVMLMQWLSGVSDNIPTAFEDTDDGDASGLGDEGDSSLGDDSSDGSEGLDTGSERPTMD